VIRLEQRDLIEALTDHGSVRMLDHQCLDSWRVHSIVPDERPADVGVLVFLERRIEPERPPVVIGQQVRPAEPR
jgi:hypothetical protein